MLEDEQICIELSEYPPFESIFETTQVQKKDPSESNPKFFYN